MSSSLLDSLLRDDLLQGIANTEIYVAIRSDLASSTTRFGAGTAENPYDCSRVDLGGGSYYYKFDKIMRDFVTANATVYLAPGVIRTEGYKSGSSSQGWTALTGVRIVGGGWAGDNSGGTTTGATVLRLEGHTSGENFAIGMGGSDILNGFELAYLSIDCNLPATASTAAGAIDVNGSHIRIHHVRCFNFGARDTTEGTVVVISRPETDDIFDAVFSDCVIENPSSNCSDASVTCVKIRSQVGGSYFHRACNVRNCYINCSGSVTDTTFNGISATGGVGTIIEQNRIWNCDIGFFVFDGAEDDLPITRDIIVRDNYLYNVTIGFYLNLIDEPADPSPIGRIVFQTNLIELTTAVAATGFKISSDAGPSTNPIVGQLVIRRNEIRHTQGDNGDNGSFGITLDFVAEAIVEENLISIGTTPDNPDNTKAIVRTADVSRMKTFNNQSRTGVFLGCWNGASHDGDLVTDVEAAIMAL